MLLLSNDFSRWMPNGVCTLSCWAIVVVVVGGVMRGGAVGLVACNEFLVVMSSFAFTLVSNFGRVGRCWMGYGCGAGLLYHAG